MIPDERRRLPSASGMERIALCPGSYSLEIAVKSAPGYVENPGSDAEHGTAVARVVEAHYRTGAPILGTARLVDDARRMVEHSRMVYVIASATFSAMESGRIQLSSHATRNYDTLVEQRIWHPCGQFSGRADVVFIDRALPKTPLPLEVPIKPKWAVIIDHKAGWLPVTVAPDNWQLRTLAVLLWRKTGCSNILVAIAQPNLGAPHIALYDADTLKAAEESILAVIENALTKVNERNPGPTQCRYCLGRRNCPEIYQKFMDTCSGKLKTDEITLALDGCDIAEMVIDDIKKSAKERLAKDPDSIPGWKLKPGGLTTVVADTMGAWKLLKAKLKPEEFVGACKVVMGSLIKAWAAATGISQKGAREELKDVLADVVETKERAPSLVRANVKEVPEP